MAWGSAQIRAADFFGDQGHRRWPFETLGQHGIGEPQRERLAIRTEVHAERGDLGGRGKGPLPLRKFCGPRDDLLERRVPRPPGTRPRMANSLSVSLGT